MRSASASSASRRASLPEGSASTAMVPALSGAAPSPRAADHAKPASRARAVRSPPMPFLRAASKVARAPSS